MCRKEIIVELDGPVHEYTKYYDYQRDLVLEKRGLRTLRISNKELFDVEEVKVKISDFPEK